MRRKERHIDFISREGPEYRLNCAFTAIHPSDVLSTVVNGADQTKLSLPNFTTSVKDQRVHGTAVHLIGLVRHGAIN